MQNEEVQRSYLFSIASLACIIPDGDAKRAAFCARVNWLWQPIQSAFLPELPRTRRRLAVVFAGWGCNYTHNRDIPFIIGCITLILLA
jgi:hypothetical protein